MPFNRDRLMCTFRKLGYGDINCLGVEAGTSHVDTMQADQDVKLNYMVW